MGCTELRVKGNDFYINGAVSYSEIDGVNPKALGLLMNARFIQGIFNDQSPDNDYNRYGKKFDPESNTDELIAALPQWYAYGLRAFTVGFQGGGPCYTMNNASIDNNPFGKEGFEFDTDAQHRMHRLIKAADQIGMVVIVSLFYPGQLPNFQDGRSIHRALKSACLFLKEGGYTNVIIEICNEMDVDKSHTLIYEEESMAVLMDLVREYSGGMIVGCSLSGGSYLDEICQASDVILIHGNDCSRQSLYQLIQQVRKAAPGKPVLCNEDSQALGQLSVAFNEHVSWGYYNNMTKQEPPTYWEITEGEDNFFAHRLAMGLGIEVSEIPKDEQYYFQGFETHMTFDNKRWLRVASLYPETIDYVEFYKNKLLVDTCYDEPYSLYWQSNWRQEGVDCSNEEDVWKVKIHLVNKQILEREGIIPKNHKTDDNEA